MQIQSGKLYENRTWKYLYPCLKHYGTELTQKLGGFFKLSVGIGDYSMDMEDKGNCIFILIDTNAPIGGDRDIQAYKSRFAKFLDWLTYQPYYVTDYVYEDLNNSGKHMVVIRIPEKYDTSYLSFIQGKYSEMYETKEVYEYFKYFNMTNKDLEKKQNEKVKERRDVFSKDKDYAKKFIKEVNQIFHTNLELEDFGNAELDFPPKLEEEIFNY